MGLFNVLKATVECPYCHSVIIQEIQFYFGVLDLDNYVIGDSVKWIGTTKSVPPEIPNLNIWSGDGYMECGVCSRTRWVSIVVENNIIKDAIVNLLRHTE